MTDIKLEQKFNKLKQEAYYYGDIELVRYFIFELDRVKEDLYRIDNITRNC